MKENGEKGKAQSGRLCFELGKTQKLALTAMLFAAAMALSAVEGMLPELPVPGVRFGLSNIAVMCALLFMGAGPGITVAVLKSAFLIITRSPVTGFISLAGGLASVLVMSVLLHRLRERLSLFALSVAGAVFHNIGQFGAVCLIYTEINLWLYVPFLLVFGAAAGTVTAILLKLALPALNRILTDKK